MRVMLRPHEFSSEWGLVPVSSGLTIAQMLEQAAGTDDIVPVSIRVNGFEVPPEYWPRLRPKEGAVIHVTPMDLHGGSVRSWLGAIAMIVLAVYAPGWGNSIAQSMGWGATAGKAIGAGIMLAGSLAINALVKPPIPGSRGGDVESNRWYSLTGSQNNINPWGAIPCVIGKMRFYPPHAAMPYSRSAGTSSYHYYMFDLGHGNLRTSDVRIGDTPIDDFDDVEWEITRNPTMYRNDVNEISVGATLADSESATRTTAPNVDEISIDLMFPGLFSLGDEGEFVPANVFFKVEYRRVGMTVWTPLENAGQVAISKAGGAYTSHPWYCRREDKKPFTAALTWTVSPGQYEVRVTRALSEWGGQEASRVGLETTWSILRSIRRTNPSTTGTTKLCMRIRATDQISGTLQSVNLLVEQLIREYDRDTDAWSEPVPSTNTAWCVWWLMTECPAATTRVPASRMDLDGFADFAEHCDEHNLRTHYVADNSSTMRDTINNLLAGSLGNLGHRDGRYTVVYDHGRAEEDFTFTPHETSNFRYTRVFARLPHALRIQFVNIHADWMDDEVIVLDDGFSHRGLDARGRPSTAPEPTIYETLRMEQAMTAQQAWQQGRFHMAQAKFRNTVYEWESDITGLGVARGDVIDMAHDLVEWSYGWARVVSIEPSDTMGAATLVLDSPVVTEPGRPLSVQFRKSDGTREVINIVGSGGITSVFALADMPEGVESGDMAIIGDRENVTTRLLLTEVRYSEGFNTAFSAVEFDERVKPYWTDPPESIISEVSGLDYAKPPTPKITVVISDEMSDDRDDAGISSPTVDIGAGDPNRGYMDVPYHYVQLR